MPRVNHLGLRLERPSSRINLTGSISTSDGRFKVKGNMLSVEGKSFRVAVRETEQQN